MPKTESLNHTYSINASDRNIIPLMIFRYPVFLSFETGIENTMKKAKICTSSSIPITPIILNLDEMISPIGISMTNKEIIINLLRK
jgi:hypothetical protein